MSYPDKVIKQVGKFEIEDLIDYGKKQILRSDISEDLIAFYKFTNELLDYEIGLQLGAESMMGSNKSFFNVVKTGSIIAAVAASNMQRYAKTTLYQLGYRRTHELKKACKKEIKKHDKYSFEGFYYRSGLRYLRATALR